MEEENKNIDKFIREGFEIENTSLDFSNKVMHQIHALDTAKEKALTSLLQKHTSEKASINFTKNVLIHIDIASKSTNYQPVIGKKAWAVILSIFIAIIFYIASFIEVSPKQLKIVNESISKLGDLFSFNLPEIIISPILALSLFALSTLLFLDYFLRNRKYS